MLDKKAAFELKTIKLCLMFDKYMMKHLVVLCYSFLTISAFAQNSNCPTTLSPEQLRRLKQFQISLDANGMPAKSAATTYVPIKFHIIGNNEGKGYYAVSSLMRAFCDLNQDFLPSGLQFYFADSISYINDNELYAGNSDAIWFRSEDYKMAGAVNVFFHGAGMQWCGVYFPGVDVVFVKNSCQGSNATTLTHELGHFFGLPHTFYGWEGGSDPGNSERLDGSNCRTAGDGFCDTKADYVSQRWSCPLPWNLIDPTGQPFKPDSSIYMSYSSDNCQSRFSEEQMAAMRFDVSQRSIGRLTADVRPLPPPALMFPISNQKNLPPQEVPLVWKSVPGAFAYHVQIARFGDWNFLNYDALVYDTTTLVNLFGTWPYAWRVKAITNAFTCAEFGQADTFSTKEEATSIGKATFIENISIYPNPSMAGSSFTIHAKESSEMIIRDIKGSFIIGFRVEPNETKSMALEVPGLYTIEVQQGHKSWVKKLIVN
jgi:hypothetical protein